MKARRSRRVVIASLCLAAQAIALAHLFLVVHTRCEEHGEVIHGEHHVEDGCDDLARWDLGGAPAEADHDHCAPFGERSELAFDAPALAAAHVVTELAPPAALPAPDATRPLYLLAPKASPPVA